MGNSMELNSSSDISTVEPVESLNQGKKEISISTTTFIDNASQNLVENVQKDASLNSFNPGDSNKMIYVKTWGCSHNNSDSEVMAGLLGQQGYTVVLADGDLPNNADPRMEADVWLLNSCTVKNPSEQTFANEIDMAHKHGKKLVLAGCVTQGSPNDARWKNVSIVGVQQIDRIVEVVEETLQGNVVQLLREKKQANEFLSEPVEDDGVLPDLEVAPDSLTYDIPLRSKRKAGGAPLALPKIRRNPLVEIVPINTGCLNTCTYCKTRHARGDLGSYPPDEIVSRIKQVILEDGVKEIWLTSEDLGAYGHDIGIPVSELLLKIVKAIEECNDPEVMLRLGMTNPPYILKHANTVAQVLNHAQVYCFMHIPVQSGSNSVLDKMKRKYTSQDFRLLCDTLLSQVVSDTPEIPTKFRHLSLATDIICGFPGEEERGHQDTMDLLDDYKFPMVHISQFYPRPGTPAARMPQVQSNIKKERSRAVTKLIESYLPYQGLEGALLKRVLVTDYAADGVRLVGHDKCYRQVLLSSNSDIMGRMVDVKIVKTSRWSLEAEILGFTYPNISRPIKPATTSTIEYVGKKRMGKVTILKKKSRNMPGDWTEDVPRGTGDDKNARLFAICTIVYLLPYLTFVSRLPLFVAVLAMIE